MEVSRQFALLPTRAEAHHKNALVRNILSTYHTASPEHKAEGPEWFSMAHDLAGHIGRGDVRKGAGIISALSAHTGWEQNVALAHQMRNTGRAATLGTNERRAQAINEGQDPVDVLPMNKKTGHFYRNILDPSDPEPVTIDRHAHDLAMGQKFGRTARRLEHEGRYNHFVDAYKTASTRLGIQVPNVLQAVTWLHYRENG